MPVTGEKKLERALWVVHSASVLRKQHRMDTDEVRTKSSLIIIFLVFPSNTDKPNKALFAT